MQIICAWCDKRMGWKQPYEDKSSTHGICVECAERMTGKVIKTIVNLDGTITNIYLEVQDDQKCDG